MPISPTIPGIIILVFIFFTQLVIGIILVHKALKKRIINLAYLATFSLAIATTFLFLQLMMYTDGYIWAALFTFFTFLSQLVLIFFIQNTYYKQQKSPFKLILLFTLGNFVFIIISQILISSFTLQYTWLLLAYAITYVIDHALVGYWMFYISFKHYYRYKLQNIEPWIKWRYLFVSITGISYAHLGVPSLINVIGLMVNNGQYIPLLYLFTFILRSILFVVFSLISFITWLMPEKLRKYFNKGFVSIKDDQELSEKDIMKEFEQKEL
ncbi:MAG: hypothetical protein ACFFAS_05610 [Promethearchaeota archaeon]